MTCAPSTPTITNLQHYQAAEKVARVEPYFFLGAFLKAAGMQVSGCSAFFLCGEQLGQADKVMGGEVEDKPAAYAFRFRALVAVVLMSIATLAASKKRRLQGRRQMKLSQPK